MNFVWKALLVAVFVAAAAWWSGPGVGHADKPADPPMHTAPPADRLPLLGPNAFYSGVAWQIHHSEKCVEQARRMLNEIADLGADAVLISNAGYQEHAGSDSFQIDPAVTPSPEEWRQIFKIAHENGLRVIFMPIILLSKPRGSEWRGVINPPNWDDWFEQYRRFLRHFAEIAEANRVEVFMVGSELVSTEKYKDRWREVIREIRRVYSGRLSYSANWDHYKVIDFWDDLDLVGMTSYYKLSNDPNPDLETLRKAWQPIKKGLLRWQAEIGKPLLFTEVGWCSQEGASIESWNYYHKQKATKNGHEEQRRCYRAFMDTWADVIWKEPPVVGGVIWWEWTDTPGGPEDFNYIPKNKPAEIELRNWFKQIRDKRHPPTTRPVAAG